MAENDAQTPAGTDDFTDITDLDKAAMEVEKARGKYRQSPTPDRGNSRRPRTQVVKEEGAQEAVATAGRGGKGEAAPTGGVADGGGGSGARQDVRNTGQSTPTDEEFAVLKTTEELALDVQILRDDLNREISKRRGKV